MNWSDRYTGSRRSPEIFPDKPREPWQLPGLFCFAVILVKRLLITWSLVRIQPREFLITCDEGQRHD